MDDPGTGLNPAPGGADLTGNILGMGLGRRILALGYPLRRNSDPTPRFMKKLFTFWLLGIIFFVPYVARAYFQDLSGICTGLSQSGNNYGSDAVGTRHQRAGFVFRANETATFSTITTLVRRMNSSTVDDNSFIEIRDYPDGTLRGTSNLESNVGWPNPDTSPAWATVSWEFASPVSVTLNNFYDVGYNVEAPLGDTRRNEHQKCSTGSSPGPDGLSGTQTWYYTGAAGYTEDDQGADSWTIIGTAPTPTPGPPVLSTPGIDYEEWLAGMVGLAVLAFLTWGGFTYGLRWFIRRWQNSHY